MRVRLLSLLATLSLLSGCANIATDISPETKSGQDNETIYLIYHSNHTGLGLNVRHAEPRLAKLRAYFPDAEYLKFNWGDRKWYSGGAHNAVTSSIALLVPTQSAMRISSIPKRPDLHYKDPGSLSSVEISRQGYENLIRFIEASFERDTEQDLRLIHSGKIKYGEFKVFTAKRKYHMLRNSNSWTSQALAAAGIRHSMIRLVAGDID